MESKKWLLISVALGAGYLLLRNRQPSASGVQASGSMQLSITPGSIPGISGVYPVELTENMEGVKFEVLITNQSSKAGVLSAYTFRRRLKVTIGTRTLLESVTDPSAAPTVYVGPGGTASTGTTNRIPVGYFGAGVFTVELYNSDGTVQLANASMDFMVTELPLIPAGGLSF